MERLDGARVWRGMGSRPIADVMTTTAQLKETLVMLKRRVAEIGPQKRPAFEFRVTNIVKYVLETTGAYNDELLSEVLNRMVPPNCANFPSGRALAEWRKKRHLIDGQPVPGSGQSKNRKC